MKRSTHLLLFFILFVAFTGVAQNVPYKLIENSHDNKHKCGFDSKCLFTKSNTTVEKIKIPGNNFINSVSCGRFRFTFMDVENQSGYGFDDPVLGPDYVQCVCDVGNFFQSIFESPTGDSTPVDVIFQDSWTAVNPSSNPWILGLGGPIFSEPDFINGLPGFYGGNAFKHYTTGYDPDSILADGIITINFNYQYFLCGQQTNCGQFDFSALILHELTHVLGWLSLINEDSLGHLINILGQNQFSQYDKFSLFYGDISTGNFQHLVDTTTISFNVLPDSCLHDNKLWLYNTPAHSLTDNQNSCVSFVRPNEDITNAISHFGDYQEVFLTNSYIAPGFQPEYIMGAGLSISYKHELFTIQEIRSLNRLGYTFTSNYLNNNNLIYNHHPFTVKSMLSNSWYYQPPFPAPDMIDNATGFSPPDYTITNCDSIIIYLSNDATIIDIDQVDPKRIYPGSLINIRGCGISGNNHNCLTVTSDVNGDYIKYKPRPDFIGRAQFGFNLYDDKERGGFMVYTIEVNPCMPNLNENIVNGNFEEGMEVCKMDTIRYIENATIYNSRNMYYEGGFGTMHPDGVKYIGWNAVAVKNSLGCDSLNGTYGNYYASFGSPGSLAVPGAANGGERYLIQWQNYLYLRLYNPMINCGRYKLDFDACLLNSTNAHLEIGFTNSPQPFNAPVSLINSQQVNLNGSLGNWMHRTIYIDFCDAAAVNYLTINNLTLNSGTYLGFDNFSMTLENENCEYCINSVVDNFENEFVFISNNNMIHELSIELNRKYSNNLVKIYDLAGRIIFTKSFVSESTIINTSDFHEGVYLVEIRNETLVKTKTVYVH